jgi:hypothetical protein
MNTLRLTSSPFTSYNSIVYPHQSAEMRFTSIATLLALAGYVVAAPTGPQAEPPAAAPSPTVPLPDGVPMPNQQQLQEIYRIAGGSLPNAPLPKKLTATATAVLQLLELNEVFEVAFFTSLLHNITTNVPGYRLTEEKREFVMAAIASIQKVTISLSFSTVRANMANDVISKKNCTPSASTPFSLARAKLRCSLASTSSQSPTSKAQSSLLKPSPTLSLASSRKPKPYSVLMAVRNCPGSTCSGRSWGKKPNKLGGSAQCRARFLPPRHS